ncbi:MAG: hypothetical protein JW818_13505 [Pirellulales bacterium]|nr:hypothetical protein [Pirellulales bacterium]
MIKQQTLFRQRTPQRQLTLVSLAVLGLLVTALPAAADWAFKKSYYSHDPASGNRVAQYSPGTTPYTTPESNYKRSGYHHHRIRQRGPGGTADNLHLVETWGEGEFIRPYGEWEYPYRAGATPYGPWGNPQGPWTTPFGSWVNPYGLGQLPNPPWFPWGFPGYRPPMGGPMGPMPMPMPGP